MVMFVEQINTTCIVRGFHLRVPSIKNPTTPTRGFKEKGSTGSAMGNTPSSSPSNPNETHSSPQTQQAHDQSQSAHKPKTQESADPLPTDGNKETLEDESKEMNAEEEEGEWGGCKDRFIEWENCVMEREKNKKDVVGMCSEVTAAMFKCMEAHQDYYGPVLEKEEEVNRGSSAAEAEAEAVMGFDPVEEED
ncbi:hypothetical protein RJ639_040201 [Escallonia herrerae]|uniref:GCK domain-containing protein n=1 Tax=Escallonia herrerae TaxID=1293975 RepID=A0AA89B5W3_9ASTE|nr:hypothetical protein RJ639_040201 [Escallonia herrerae]